MIGRWCYTGLLYLIQPILLIRLYLRAKKSPDYRNRIKERYGYNAPIFQPHGIWLHCVSVGETIAAIPLIKALQNHYPECPITVTTMTPTGSKQVTKSFGESVQHCYLPYDLPCAMHRLINTIDPKLVIIMETELWPNLIHQLHKKHIPVMLANGRLSERSEKGYQKVRAIVSPMLQEMSLIVAQYATDADRYKRLGANPQTTIVSGSIKFDIEITQALREDISRLKRDWNLNNRPVWIAASTHEGEDDILLNTHQRLLAEHPTLLLILVPRHPERFNDVFTLSTQRQLNTVKLSEHPEVNAHTQVLLGDTMGQLMMLYGLANMAFIGGSLIERGGHNPLEPAAYGLPLVMGKHVFNFSSICHMLQEHHGLTLVENESELTSTLQRWLNDPVQAQHCGQQALSVLKLNQGALDKHLTLIDQLLPSSTFHG